MQKPCDREYGTALPDGAVRAGRDAAFRPPLPWEPSAMWVSGSDKPIAGKRQRQADRRKHSSGSTGPAPQKRDAQAAAAA